MSTLPMENNASSRVAKLLEMARRAINAKFHKEDALKCYKAVLQLDPNNVEADFYTFLLTPYEVKVYDPQISEYYSNLISKYQAFLKNLKDRHLSGEELRKTIERTWDIIENRCFTEYTRHTNHLEKEELLKEIQGHSVRLEAAEKVGDSIIAEFPELKGIAVKVWGYEVGVIYQSIANLKDETKYDPDAIDVWEGNKITYDIYKVARKILEINNKYISPYTECPQEIKVFFKQTNRAQMAAEEATEKMKMIFLKSFLTILVIALYIGLGVLFDGFIIVTLFGGILGILAIILIWAYWDELI